MPQVNELKFIAKCKCAHPVHIEVEALKISGCYGLGIERESKVSASH